MWQLNYRMLAKNLQEGNLFAWQNWHEIVQEIDTHNVFCTQAVVHREDGEIWMSHVHVNLGLHNMCASVTGITRD
jgi:hypothetical protein